MRFYPEEEKNPKDGFRKSSERRQKQWQRTAEEMEELQSFEKRGITISHAQGPRRDAGDVDAQAPFLTTTETKHLVALQPPVKQHPLKPFMRSV